MAKFPNNTDTPEELNADLEENARDQKSGQRQKIKNESNQMCSALAQLHNVAGHLLRPSLLRSRLNNVTPIKQDYAGPMGNTLEAETRNSKQNEEYISGDQPFRTNIGV